MGDKMGKKVIINANPLNILLRLNVTTYNFRIDFVQKKAVLYTESDIKVQK